jgi:hypothetical protein
VTEALEPVDVELVFFDPDQVAAGLAQHAIGADRRAQPGDEDVEVAPGVV